MIEAWALGILITILTSNVFIVFLLIYKGGDK